ncbi:methyltransferase domain-containing protein [Phytohabitans sp. ZYX-F-186]|uniref:Methyltransferase domain-containing protein n=1 Tax=Phytohabitans maris TaxID=3071409 RepID=A0ABU0ZSU5_9ACTN|nr:methyltransferase domain-containing protein [Phytohabitans sp. ZYX-F-186]MDQ7910028.1 methyltransferase domain-containing protein [Phytohabitans sp. ZYX-F-186]
MDAPVLANMRCPVCGEPLGAAPGVLRCPRGHSFDIARQGYVNLSTGRSPHTGDTAEMVAARAEFLAAGHYDFISTALAAAARAAYPGGLVLDAGAGTGRHLAAVLDALPAAPGLALDVSKPALRRAARAHPRAGAALCDTWGRLPVADGSAGVVLDVFAPRNGTEFRRVLRPGGVLLVVTPAADHLAELVERLSLLQVDPEKAERVAASLEGHFRLAEETSLTRTLTLSPREAATLVGMGPSAWHTVPATAALRSGASPVTVTASVRLGVYVERSTSSQPAGGS